MGDTLTRARTWFGAHPFEVDIAIALLVGALSLSGLLVADIEGSERSPDALAMLLIVGQTAALAYRRRTPLVVLLVIVSLTVVFWVSDYPTDFDVFSLLAVYAATRYGGDHRRRVWMVVGAAVAALTIMALVGVLIPTEDLPAVAVFGIAVIHGTAAIIGETVYSRQLRLVALEQRAARAEAERELLARQAVLDERARIARDLHDVVAHGMSVMVVQAAAAERVVERDPAAARSALGHIQEAGRDGLAQMRRILDVLRDESSTATHTPQPTLDDLEVLVQHCSDSGIHTELAVEGDPPARATGQMVAAYRVVQEALTNVIKHAGRPARASVRVRYDDDRISVEVIDDGVGASQTSVAGAMGHGFVGMQERVDLYGGTLRVGPRPGGGFRVAASMPLDRAHVDHAGANR